MDAAENGPEGQETTLPVEEIPFEILADTYRMFSFSFGNLFEPDGEFTHSNSLSLTGVHTGAVLKIQVKRMFYGKNVLRERLIVCEVLQLQDTGMKKIYTAPPNNPDSHIMLDIIGDNVITFRLGLSTADIEKERVRYARQMNEACAAA